MLGERAKSLLIRLTIYNYSSVLPTFQVGYYAGQPMERAVYRFDTITMGSIFQCNKRYVF